MENLFEIYSNNHYFTKDELFKEKNYKNNQQLKQYDLNEFWKQLNEYRLSNSNFIELNDKLNIKLKYYESFIIKDYISKIVEVGSDQIEDLIPNDIKDATLIDSIIDEAFSSSVIEGAFSTRKRAKEMITKKLDPKTKSERMIFNNFKAIRYTLDNLETEINNNFIYEIWKILTEGTLEEDDYTELYRTGPVYIKNRLGDIVYEGPNFHEVNNMMDDLVRYINNTNDSTHPIIKSIIIHYYFVYVHPFFDGNGRTARALMNFYLIKSGFDFFKYFSISKILVDKRSKYYDSIKQCEDNHSDITYFIEFYSELLIDTIIEIRKTYINQFSKKIILKLLYENNIHLNQRQLKTLDMILKKDKKSIDVKDYTKQHKVVQETARKDLNNMSEYGIFEIKKFGNKYIYKFREIKDILENIKNH